MRQDGTRAGVTRAKSVRNYRSEGSVTVIRHWCRSFPLLMVPVAQGWSVPPGWLWRAPQESPAWSPGLTILLMWPSGRLLPQRRERGVQTYQWTLLALRHRSRPRLV